MKHPGQEREMEFVERLSALSFQMRQQGCATHACEITRIAFTIPFTNFFQGGDVSVHSKVASKDVYDAGAVKGETIDYVFRVDVVSQVMIESNKILNCCYRSRNHIDLFESYKAALCTLGFHFVKLVSILSGWNFILPSAHR